MFPITTSTTIFLSPTMRVREMLFILMPVATYLGHHQHFSTHRLLFSTTRLSVETLFSLDSSPKNHLKNINFRRSELFSSPPVGKTLSLWDVAHSSYITKSSKANIRAEVSVFKNCYALNPNT
jgi:hypothetical protein